MNEKSEVTQQATTATTREKSESGRVIQPAVDVFEDETGITVHADMPGVTREHLDIRIDRDTLTLTGEADIATPEGMQPLYADVRLNRYQRSFSLSGELDAEQADASLKDGVLTLRIPKHARYQPRKIEVRVS
jgi:HSP20 family protein